MNEPSIAIVALMALVWSQANCTATASESRTDELAQHGALVLDAGRTALGRDQPAARPGSGQSRIGPDQTQLLGPIVASVRGGVMAVSQPASLVLLGTGLIGLGLMLRRRKHASTRPARPARDS